MIRIHDIRIVSADVAEADVAWGPDLSRRDWFRIESQTDDVLGVPVTRPSVPSEFSVRYLSWLWTISAAIDRVRRGEPVELPLDITSCRKPGVPEPTDVEKATSARWSRIRYLEGKLFSATAEERSRITSDIEILRNELAEIERPEESE